MSFRQKVVELVCGVPHARYVDEEPQQQRGQQRGSNIIAPNEFGSVAEAKSALFSDKDGIVRASAALTVEDYESLKKVIFKDKNWMVRAAAIARIMDNEVIERVAVKDVEPIVRELAVNKLVSYSLLQQIALTDKDRNVRLAASKRLQFNFFE